MYRRIIDTKWLEAMAHELDYCDYRPLKKDPMDPAYLLDWVVNLPPELLALQQQV